MENEKLGDERTGNMCYRQVGFKQIGVGETTKSTLLRVMAVKVVRQSAGSPKPLISIEKRLLDVLKCKFK